MKKIIFTAHAKDRCLEYGFPFKQTERNFRRARQTVPPARTRLINRIYHKQKHTLYKWAAKVLYTYIVKGNAYVILTVTPKEIKDITFKT